MKVILYGSLILGCIPYIFCASLLTFYFNAASTLGYFPSYNHPDPKILSYYQYHSTVINLTFDTLIIAFLPWIVLSIYMFKKNIKQSSNIVVFGAIGYFLSLVLFFSEVLEWYVD